MLVAAGLDGLKACLRAFGGTLSLKRNHTPSHIKTRELHLVRATFLFVMRVHLMHFLKRRLA